METSIVTVKGQIVIPAKIRRKFGLAKGTRVVFIETKEGFTVKPLNRKYFEEYAGLLGNDGSEKAGAGSARSIL
jgi:AbrB family looped-hinge helix DNA binding protein